MKTTLSLKSLRLAGLAGALAVAGAGVANATLINQTFTNGNEGGIVTFTDSQEPGSGLLANQLKITFDNTTSGPTYSTAITGIIFNIIQDINSISSWTFVDGNGVDISNQWSVLIDQDSLISDGNTTFDITFLSGNIPGGIYNAASPGSNVDNVYPDIATLILTISNPNPYDLVSVGSDSELRMQRAGIDGEGSLKLVTSTSSSTTSGQTSGSTGTTTSSTTSGGTSVPEPGMLGLLGLGLLGQALVLRQRRRRLRQQ